MKFLYTKFYETPLGKMVAFANHDALLMLDFEDSKYAEKHLEEISSQYGVIKKTGNKVLTLLEKELKLYFEGKLTQFSVPVEFSGTEFQKKFGKNYSILTLASSEVIKLKPMP
jgi:O6-methylguanine-DNA--protein-cysteine methyltransferase